MKVLCLGPYRKEMERFLISQGDEPFFTEEPLEAGAPFLNKSEYLVSFGYRHLLSEKVLSALPRRAVNIHISYLPWNRGADPNLWSFLEDTPKGVSIHYLSAKVDSGELLCQEKATFSSNETLRTSYDKLIEQAHHLFENVWPRLKTGKAKAVPQAKGGSFHRTGDALAYQSLLRAGWDTLVSELVGKAAPVGRGF